MLGSFLPPAPTQKMPSNCHIFEVFSKKVLIDERCIGEGKVRQLRVVKKEKKLRKKCSLKSYSVENKKIRNKKNAVKQRTFSS
jgi:hypothetical protein